MQPQPQGVDSYMGMDVFKRSDAETFSGSHHEQVQPNNLSRASVHDSATSPPHNGMYNSDHSINNSAYISPSNYTFPMQPPGYATSNNYTQQNQLPQLYTGGGSVDHAQQQQSNAELNILDQMAEPTPLPVFGGAELGRSTFAIPDDLVAYLFTGQQVGASVNGPHVDPTE